MNKNRLTLAVAGLALAGLGTACSDTGTTNANRVTANTAASNTAVVVNNNGNANTSTVSTTNANARVNANITREEYERDKDRYTKEAKDAGSTIGQGAEDGWLWTKTRAALLTTDDLRESTVNVDVNNNVVTLKGSVATAAQKTKAEQVAKGIEGVKSVKNELKVAPADGVMTGNSNANRNANTANTNAARKN